MLAARVSWVGPSFLSTIRQETPYRFSSAAMNRPAGPAPTTNTWVSAAIRYPFVPARCADPRQLSDRQRAVLDIRVLKSEKPADLLGSKLNKACAKACSSTSASGPIPDIGL